MAMKFPENLKYSVDHEWVRMEGNDAIIGITDFAQSELGDIVYVDVDTVDEELEEGAVFGSIEAVKTVSDLVLPVSGTIVELNAKLEDNPELINKDPYGEGWIIRVSNAKPSKKLLDAAGYKNHIGQ